MKRILRFLGLMFILPILLVITCSATQNSSLTYWYAYDNGYATSEGWYCSSRPYGKVRVDLIEDDTDVTKAAETLIYGITPWNDASFLPFTIQYRSNTSTLYYTFEVTSGTYSWLSQVCGGAESGTVGKTRVGSFEGSSHTAYYGNSSKTIKEYTGTSENGATLFHVCVLNNLSESELRLVAAHEIGHVLGWSGHSNSASDLMHPTHGNLTTVAISNRDKNHIDQFYDLFY